MSTSQFYLLQGHLFGIWFAVGSGGWMGLLQVCVSILCYGMCFYAAYKGD